MGLHCVTSPSNDLPQGATPLTPQIDTENNGGLIQVENELVMQL